jgi:hypothetical protein
LEAITVATKLRVRAPEAAPTGPEAMTAALIAWRAADRQLAELPAGSPEGNVLRAQIEALRLLYKELSGQFAARAKPEPRPMPRAGAKPAGRAKPRPRSAQAG